MFIIMNPLSLKFKKKKGNCCLIRWLIIPFVKMRLLQKQTLTLPMCNHTNQNHINKTEQLNE